MRVKFYREHKYVSAILNDLERLIAKSDFRQTSQIETAKEKWGQVADLLKAHAQYEEEKLHSLLEKKGSSVHLEAQDQHEVMEDTFLAIDRLFDELLREKDSVQRIETGCALYLTFRKFVGENLLHLHEEETKILPELQRLYTDEELRQVEDSTYKLMSSEELLAMFEELFPHMNASDKEAFLEDVRLSQPEKFQQIVNEIDALCS